MESILIIIALHLGSYDVIQTKTYFNNPAECQRAIKKVISRTHKIIWKGCVA